MGSKDSALEILSGAGFAKSLARGRLPAYLVCSIMLDEFLIIGTGNLAWGLPSIAVLAIALIAISIGQFAAMGIASSRMAFNLRKRRRIDLRGLRQAAEISRLKSELKSSEGGTSVTWRVMEVVQVVDESVDCRSYYLMDVYRQDLPMFQPGQHVLVRPAMAGANQTTRCYSLSSSPDSRCWRITVKRKPLQDAAEATSDQLSRQTTQRSLAKLRASLGQSTGLSSWLHSSVAVGDCLLVGGPGGHFFLKDDHHRPLVLLAAGVGITPLASMLLWSQGVSPARPIRMLYQVQDLSRWPLGQALHRSLDQLADGRVISFFSRGADSDLTLLRKRLPGDLRLGKFHAMDAVDAAVGLDCDYFLCGPDAWMASLRDGLRKAGVAAGRVHWESFGSSALTTPVSAVEMKQPLAVQFERSGLQAEWSDPQQSLWELARQHHVDIPSGCLSGVCGACRVKVLQGQVAHDRPVAIDLPEDECLPCIARPKTACRIDV